jgi:hypothetical protein
LQPNRLSALSPTDPAAPIDPRRKIEDAEMPAVAIGVTPHSRAFRPRSRVALLPLATEM